MIVPNFIKLVMFDLIQISQQIVGVNINVSTLKIWGKESEMFVTCME